MTPRPHRRRSSKESRAPRCDVLDLVAPCALMRSLVCLAPPTSSRSPPFMTGVSPMATHHVIQAALQSAVDDGVFPGAQLAVRLRGELQCVAVAGTIVVRASGPSRTTRYYL